MINLVRSLSSVQMCKMKQWIAIAHRRSVFRPGNAFCSAMHMYDTIVIGMGAAGTTAAATLAQAGKKVLALEAQNHVGGRVNTVPFGDGIIELGAEWIHGTKSSPVYDLAIQNKVSILPQEQTFQVSYSDETADRQDILNDLTRFALEVINDPPKDPQPLGQYITNRINGYLKCRYPSIQNDRDFIKSFLEFIDLLIDNYESSNSWNDVTTESRFAVLGGHQRMSWHKHGYKTLFDILLNIYNNGPGYPNLDIKLNSEVTLIQWPQDPNQDVVVTVKDGTTYTAKNVIITVSVGVLKERYSNIFSPQLPQDKVDAINSISFGLLDKVIFEFPQSWWNRGEFFNWFWDQKSKDEVSAEDAWVTKITLASNPLGLRNALTVWFAGDRAKLVETLPDDVVKRKVMGVIRKFMGAGKNKPEPIQMIRSSWFSNPFTRGSYSYDGLNTPTYPTARADLARPLTDSSGAPRVLFAGEATDNTHFSTVHGAVDTGRREAERLLSPM